MRDRVCNNDIYINFSNIYFENKKEIYTLMKHFMYIVGSILSAYFLLVTKLDEVKCIFSVSKIQLLFIFILILNIIIMIYLNQIKSLSLESKQLIQELFLIERKENQIYLFQNFDYDFEFFGSFFSIFMNIFSAFLCIVLLFIFFYFKLSYWNIFFLFGACILLISSIRDLYLLIFSDFNKKRLDTFFSIIFVNPVVLVSLYIYFWPFNLLLIIMIRFFRTLLMLWIKNKPKNIDKYRHGLKYICEKLRKVKHQKRELVEEAYKVFIVDLCSTELKKINKKILDSNDNIYEKRLQKNYRNEKLLYLKLKKLFRRFIKKIEPQKYEPFLKDKNSLWTKLTIFLLLVVLVLAAFIYSCRKKLGFVKK